MLFNYAAFPVSSCLLNQTGRGTPYRESDWVTLTSILDLRTRNLAFDLDSAYGESETLQQQVDSVNWAIRAISARIFQYDPKITLTLTAGMADYNLRDTAVVSRKIIRPFSVCINGSMLWDASRNDYGMWTLAELERRNPSWRTDTSSIPTKAVYYGGNRLLLHPTPTADVVSAGNNFISGQYLAANLTTSDGSNSPDIPEELHEAIAYYAAAHSALPNLSENEAWQRVSAYNAEWQSSADTIRRENLRAIQSWGSTAGDYTRDYLFF